MTTIEQIQNATDCIDLSILVEEAAHEFGVTLWPSLTYQEEAEELREQLPRDTNGMLPHQIAAVESDIDMISILEAAETRWFEIEC